MRAVYGVYGKMEWVALIPTRSNILRVRFTGGSMTGYGVTPATFSTTNEVVMSMIESSTYFKDHRIRLLSKGGEERKSREPTVVDKAIRRVRNNGN